MQPYDDAISVLVSIPAVRGAVTEVAKMLVLSRKRNERFVVSVAGYTINIELLDVRGNKVRLGIDASQDVRVHRDEIWQGIISENAPSESLPAASYRSSS